MLPVAYDVEEAAHQEGVASGCKRHYGVIGRRSPVQHPARQPVPTSDIGMVEASNRVEVAANIERGAPDADGYAGRWRIATSSRPGRVGPPGECITGSRVQCGNP